MNQCFLKSGDAVSPLVVMCHNAYPIVRRGDVFHMWNASTAQIRNLVLFLASRYEFIDEAYLLENAGNPEALRGKVLLTFDDGYANVYTELKDFLRELHIVPCSSWS